MLLKNICCIEAKRVHFKKYGELDSLGKGKKSNGTGIRIFKTIDWVYGTNWSTI